MGKFERKMAKTPSKQSSTLLIKGQGGCRKSRNVPSASKYYPADDVKLPRHSRKTKKNAPKTRASITAGVVVILLAGRFRGKRVVCLKVLESGLLLISGPFSVNGVPLRRVNPRYVIACCTKLDVSSIDVSHINGVYFKKEKKTSKEGEEEFFDTDPVKPAVVSETRKNDQKKVDDVLIKIVGEVPLFKQYLSSLFSLRKYDRPHQMVF